MSEGLTQMMQVCKSQTPFRLTIEFKLSRYQEAEHSTHSGGNERLNIVLSDAREHKEEYGTYWRLLRDAGRACTSLLTAVIDAANETEPEAHVKDEQARSSNQCDILVIYTLDNDLQKFTEIEPTENCSEAMRKLLTEGTLEFDFEMLWKAIDTHVKHVFCLAFAPEYGWELS